MVLLALLRTRAMSPEEFVFYLELECLEILLLYVLSLIGNLEEVFFGIR
jgi:hypothetical protein